VVIVRWWHLTSCDFKQASLLQGLARYPRSQTDEFCDWQPYMVFLCSFRKLLIFRTIYLQIWWWYIYIYVIIYVYIYTYLFITFCIVLLYHTAPKYTYILGGNNGFHSCKSAPTTAPAILALRGLEVPATWKKSTTPAARFLLHRGDPNCYFRIFWVCLQWIPCRTLHLSVFPPKAS